MDIAADDIFYGVTFLPTTLHAMKCSNHSIQNLWIAITSSLWMDDGDDNLMLPLLPRCVRERFCQWHAIYAWAALCVSRNGAHTRYRDCNIVCIHLGNPLDPIDRFLISTKVAMPERFCQWHARYAWAALCVSRNEAHTYTLSRLQCCLHTSWETLGSNRQISYLHRGCHARVP